MVTAVSSGSFWLGGGSSQHNEMATEESRMLFGAPWKLIVIGAPKVGKSSLAYKFVSGDGSLDDKRRDRVEYSTTIAASDGRMLNVQIFCQPTNTDFDYLDDNFFDGAHGALFVFSTTDAQVGKV